MLSVSVDASELKSKLDECWNDAEEIKNRIIEFNNKYTFADVQAIVSMNNEELKGFSMDLVRIRQK
jgi:wobble nucleotide-excising tRNase